MKCTKIEQYILLDQSNELASRKQRILKTHLASCAACRAFEAETRQLMHESRATETETQLSDFTRHRIQQEAHAQRTRSLRIATRGKKELFQHAWPMMLSYATVLVLAFAGWSILRSPPQTPSKTLIAQARAVNEEWDNELDQEMKELDNMLVMTLQEWQNENTSEATSDDTGDWAEELLLLEKSS